MLKSKKIGDLAIVAILITFLAPATSWAQRQSIECDGCGYKIGYDLAGDLHWAIPANANFSDGSVRTSNGYYRQLQHNQPMDQWFRQRTGNPTRRGAVASTVCGTGEYQYCDEANYFDMRLNDGKHLYQLLVDTVADKAYVNYGNGIVRQIMFGVQHFREPFAWESPYKKGSPWCADSIVNGDNPCPDQWDVDDVDCPDCDCPSVFEAKDDTTSVGNPGDNLRLGGTGYPYVKRTFIRQYECDGSYTTKLSHSENLFSQVPILQEYDTLFIDVPASGCGETATPDTSTASETPEKDLVQAEFRPMIELGQLTKLQLRFGGSVLVTRRLALAAHGGVQLAPHMLDYGMRGSEFEDSLWHRGFYGFAGDIEAIYSLRPEKAVNPQLVAGVQGEFGTTELSGERKHPSNVFQSLSRVNVSPYAQFRLEFGKVAAFAGWNLFPTDYFNRWEVNPQGGDRWWNGVKRPDLHFGLNVKF